MCSAIQLPALDKVQRSDDVSVCMKESLDRVTQNTQEASSNIIFPQFGIKGEVFTAVA